MMARIHRSDTTGRAVARLLAIGVVTVLVALAVVTVLVALAVVMWLLVRGAVFVVIDMGLGL